MPKQIEKTKKEKCVVELRDEKVTSLDMLTATKKYSQTLDYVDKPSITSDTMFKTMIQCEKRKKYAAYLISLVTTFDYRELLSSMTLTTNELPKKYRKTKGQRSDFVAKIKDAYINIEVNNNKDIETLERNLAYCFKLYDQTKMGDENDYNSTLQINLNNFSYEEIEDTVSIYYLKDKSGIVLTRKIAIMNIWVPNLLKKCYTKGIESLTELEKYIYSLIEVDTKKLDKIISEVPIVKEYVNEAKEVIEEPFFGEAYDHEQANKDQWYNDGYEDSKIKLIKSMYENGANLELIAKSSEMNIEQIKEIVKDVKQNFGEAYDHEQANKEQSYNDGYEDGVEKGIEKGIEQGEKNKQIEMIKVMYEKDISLEDIASIVKLSINEVKEILNIK